jgi:hypothetical protein
LVRMQKMLQHRLLYTTSRLIRDVATTNVFQRLAFRSLDTVAELPFETSLHLIQDRIRRFPGVTMEVEHKPFAQRKPDQLVYLELGAGNGGMLLSVSEEGFRFRAVSPVRAQGTLPFAFSLDGQHRLDGSGTIEWLEEDGKSGGLRFTDVSDEFRSAVSRWLTSDPPHHLPRREATPAAAVPLDTMEKIRQELRAGYPASSHPAETVATPAVPERTADANSSTPSRNLKPRFFQRSVESKDSQPARLPAPHSRRGEPEKPAIPASAFLKRPQESKPFTPVSPLAPVRPAPSTIASSVSAIPAEPPVSGERRPYIPAFEDSFESAWERSKLSAPPDSPHLSRAAAGSIISIALAVILGALAYNFRQDIGSLFIHLGQRISGENTGAAPATASETDPTHIQQNAEQKSLEPASPSQTVSGETGRSSQTSDSPHPSAANDTLATGTPARMGAPSAGATQPSGASSVPDVAKQHEVFSVQVPPDVPAKPQTPLEPGTGQEEFNLAREILQGNNRKRELPRALDLLWSGVKKGNVPAEVTLADLFLRGDGVEKNCDQARVLLVAASKKGSFDARQMLEQMAEQGCE